MNQSVQLSHQNIAQALRQQGFAFAPASTFTALLPADVMSHWSEFAAGWNDLGMDTYMADGGRYRRRRFEAFAVTAQAIIRKPRQPHYQSTDYNTLNGGIERWFQSFNDRIAAHPILLAILRSCHRLFDELVPVVDRPPAWHVECHQFRIEAQADAQGKPTPEGLHRDGVDWVLVMLVARENIVEGMTTIHDAQRQLLGSFTLAEPCDAAFVDDSRVYHGVTPVSPLDVTRPAYRDVLVVTFRRA
ncbi:MAG: 2OG-Fe dioxygenase family protein [Steroidobacteraceae bacterium]